MVFVGKDEEIRLQDGNAVQSRRRNNSHAPSFEHPPVIILREIGMASEQFPARLNSLVELERFKEMQRVVMHKDGDRSLRRQEVRGVLDRFTKIVANAINRSIPRFMMMRNLRVRQDLSLSSNSDYQGTIATSTKIRHPSCAIFR